nr:putative 5'/3'-nucleotidase SurE [uncultured bacterium]
MKNQLKGLIAGVMLPLVSLPASALDIVLTNDDGFETPYIQALFSALTAAGHNVVMSAPYLGQSGTGGKINFLMPIFPTSEPSEEGSVAAGSAGVGPAPAPFPAQQYYVDGSPSDAVLHGIDVLAPQIFGAAPDLVISGPNEGNNLGLITPHSGTLGATVAGLNKGIPSIAVSADRLDRGDTEEQVAAEAELIAAVTLRVVDALDGRHGIKLPRDTGLNINIPDVDGVEDNVLPEASNFKFKLTKVGRASVTGLQFYENIGDSPIANLVGIPPQINLPGLSVDIPYTLSNPEDNSRRSEGNVIDEETLKVTVSPIEGTYAADQKREQVRNRLHGLFSNHH